MPTYLILIVLFFELYGLKALAQNTRTDQQSILVTVHKGFILQHRQNLEPLVQNHIHGIGIAYERKTSGKRQWEQDYNRPTWGIAIEHYNLGNPSQLGNAIALYPYFKLQLLQRKRWGIQAYLGWGISYLSKVWDAETNFKNNIISSHINIDASVGTHFSYSLNKRIALSSGFRFTHYSNGAVKYPNLGVNLVSAYGAIAYHVTPEKKVDYDSETISSKTYKWLSTLTITGFRKGESAGYEKKYPVLNANLAIQRKVNSKVFVQLGGDLFYDTWLEYHFLKEHIDFAPDKDYLLYGTFASIGLSLGKIKTMLSVGHYFGKLEHPNGKMYNRLTTQYYFTQNILGSFSIKAHQFQADYFEMGIGFRLWKK